MPIEAIITAPMAIHCVAVSRSLRNASPANAAIAGSRLIKVPNVFVVSCRNVTNPINSIFNANLVVPYNDVPFGSMHPGGMNACLGDGSVRYVAQNISMVTYRALASRDQGETITLE